MSAQAKLGGATILLATVSPFLLSANDLSSNRSDRLLGAHNDERRSNGLAPLRWDDELEKAAEAWAQHLQKRGDLVHAPMPDGDPQGENLWAGTRGAFAPEAMVAAWVHEKSNYRQGTYPNVSRTGNVADVGHYTQVMWRRTNRVGCAIGENDREEFLVCRYKTAGNVLGERPF